MSPTFIVVTGCSQGLGLHAVMELARGAGDRHIVLACRNVTAARAAADRIAGETSASRDRLVVLDTPLDLADLASVRAYAKALRAHLAAAGAPNGITMLVNNAGIGGSPDFRKTTDGYDLIFESNHLGHFLLTLLLLPASAAAGTDVPLRIVNVSSEVHDPANKTPLPDPKQHWPTTSDAYDRHLARGEPFDGENARASGGRRYSRSKACNVFFTHELARRTSGELPNAVATDARAMAATLDGSRACRLPGAGAIEVLAFNPGLMLDTGFVAGVAGSFMAKVARTLTPVLRRTRIGHLMRSGPMSGADLASIATSATLPAKTAAYYDGPRLHPTSEFTRSMDGVTRCAPELWEHSMRWAGVTAEERAEAGFPV
jgi:NAD(P)-dependent dehydrogenase (short-subunit alcohol dehydrogenase family)